MTADTDRQCERCGERTLNERLCRDCDLDEAIRLSSCEECGRFIFRSDLNVPRDGHDAGCSMWLAHCGENR